MHFSFRQCFLLVVFSILILATSAIHTLHTTFFPFVVAQRRIGTVGTTLILSIFDVGAVLCSIGIGFHVSAIRFNRMLCLSTFLQAFAVTLFGTLVDVRGHWMFVGYSLFLRLCEGVGFAGTAIAVYSVIPMEFHTVNIGLIYGVLNMCFGLGNLGGPYFGEVLYDVGGYFCPFFAIGFVLLTLGLFMPLIFWRLPVDLDPLEPKLKFSALFRKSPTLLNFFVLGLEMMLLVLMFSVFPSYLSNTFNFDAYTAESTFAILVVIQAVTCPFWGFITGEFISPQLTVLSGGFLTVLGSILIGPLPVLNIKPNLLLTVIGVTTMSIGMAAIFQAVFLCLLKDAYRFGFPENRITAGMVSAAYMGTMSLGGVFGATNSGLLYEVLGYKYLPYAFVVLGVLVFSLNISYTGITTFKRIFQKLPSQDSGIEDPSYPNRQLHTEETAETSPLLKKNVLG